MTDARKLFCEVLEEFNNDSKWDSASFAKIKTISNTKVGSVGQAFIEKLCGKLKLQCTFPQNAKGKRLAQNPWDVKINGVEFELKTATEDTTNHFQFNHIRYHRKYHAVLCLGVAPEDLYFGLWSKADVATGKAGNMVSMEKSANASYKLTKAPADLYPISHFKADTELKADVEKIENRRSQFREIRKLIEAALPSLPEMSLTKLYPISENR